jgi:hypothetical protein
MLRLEKRCSETTVRELASIQNKMFYFCGKKVTAAVPTVHVR